MIAVNVEDKTETIMVLSEKGYGKRTDIEDYRITNRGGKGVTTLKITEKTGNLVGILLATDNDHIMIINKSGVAIRLAVEQMRVMGRATQGVKLIKLDKKDSIAAIARIKDGKETFNAEEDGELGETESGTDIETTS
jgi:DNA gyrase subunit A